MKLLKLKRPSITSVLLVLVLALQLHALVNTPKQYVSKTEVYNTGQRGYSTYDLWLSHGHQGTLDDFLTTLKGQDAQQPLNGLNGKNGVAYAIPANDGRDGASCEAPTQDEIGDTVITCAGKSVMIPKPKDGTNAPAIHFNQNKETCYLEYKSDTDRFWFPLIKDQECFKYGS